MPIGGGGGGGGGTPFNGGTITAPLAIHSTDLAAIPLDVTVPANWPFDVSLLRFLIGTDQVAALTASGTLQLGTATFPWGLLTTADTSVRGGNLQVATTGGVNIHGLGQVAIGFFGAAGTAQAGAIIAAAGGAVQDAEARTAINALLVAMRGYGLIHA